jgi:hypothetical protein
MIIKSVNFKELKIQNKEQSTKNKDGCDSYEGYDCYAEPDSVQGIPDGGGIIAIVVFFGIFVVETQNLASLQRW